ncbi:hypothetical protein K504DRAFT_117284, partial [Pleomassaria siparia CBS 279.74]
RPIFHIRPQDNENNASRLLCDIQALYRRISSQVGDHWRIPAVVCFCHFLVFAKAVNWKRAKGMGDTRAYR